MSAKLDQSLDEILSSRRQGARRGTRRRGAAASKAAAAAAPVGGVKKTTKAAKAAGKGAATGPTKATGESKIMVSGLVSPFMRPSLVLSLRDISVANHLCSHQM